MSPAISKSNNILQKTNMNSSQLSEEYYKTIQHIFEIIFQDI